MKNLKYFLNILNTMKYECEICAGDFSKSKIIECGYCDLKACRDCNKTYLLSRTDEIHCMGCRNKWNLEFLS